MALDDSYIYNFRMKHIRFKWEREKLEGSSCS